MILNLLSSSLLHYLALALIFFAYEAVQMLKRRGKHHVG